MISALVRSKAFVPAVSCTGALLSHSISNCSADVSPSSSKVKIGLCQMGAGADKEFNIAKAKGFMQEAKAKGAEVIVLPECWNSPYATSSFPIYAEEVPAVGGTVTSLQKAPSAFMLCDVARREKVWIVGGSIPEREGNKVFNTCLVINPEGVIVAKHRKVHLFDINIPGKMVFRESDTLTAGDSVTTVETPWGRVGVGICYDMRFPELATVMRQKGCGILLYPGAFNMTTGPLHWELLQRARAVDNALYVVTVSPSRAKDTKGYVAYGHSSVISPMGEVLADAGTEDRVVVQELDLEKVAAMRQQIPCFNQKRHDLYETISKK